MRKILFDEKDPWKNDKLERKLIAERLNDIIKDIEQPFVMTLCGRYGSGKTTFAQSWRWDLENAGTRTVYFNAWASDYSNDAFAAFVNVVSKSINEPDTKKKFLEKSKNFLGAVMRGTTKAVINAGVKKVTGENVDDFLENLETSDDILAEIFSSAAGEVFKAQEVVEDSLEEFKNILKEYISSLKDKRLLVFVDELDRCRPNYAVEVLERIKHVFDIPGIIFVILIDKNQLLNSISGVYGTKLDANGYYRKFVDWDFILPEPSSYNYVQHLAHDIYLLPDTLSDTRENLFPYAHVATLISAFADVYKLSLRDIDQLFTRINLAVQKSGTDDNAILVFAIALKFCEPTEYKTIAQLTEEPVTGRHTIEALFSKLKESIFNSLPVEVPNPRYFAMQFLVLASNSSQITNSVIDFSIEPEWFVNKYVGLQSEDIEARLTRRLRDTTSHTGHSELLRQLNFLDTLDF